MGLSITKLHFHQNDYFLSTFLCSLHKAYRRIGKRIAHNAKDAVPVSYQKLCPQSDLYHCPKILIHECHGNPHRGRLLFIAAVFHVKGIIIKLIMNHHLPAQL